MKLNARRMKLLAPILTVGILVAIYLNIDRSLLLQYLSNLHPGYFALALSLFVPQILISSLRWKTMTSQICPMGLGQSLQQVMASKALNALVPSKMGEMSKAYFLRVNSDSDLNHAAVPAVIFEKILDMGGLCTLLMLGWLFAPERGKPVWLGAAVAAGSLAVVALLLVVPLKGLGDKLVSWNARLKWLKQLLAGWDTLLVGWQNGAGLLRRILGLSVLLWVLHVLQIYLFFPSLNHPVPLAPALAFIPLSILVGLLPITIAGMGTRDAALIVLFAPYAGPALVAGVGLFCSMRYWVDTLLGVPFLHGYTSRMSQFQAGKQGYFSGKH
jgi:uncharacterized protein (TIRG00374 family)